MFLQFIVISALAARESAHNNLCGPLP